MEAWLGFLLIEDVLLGEDDSRKKVPCSKDRCSLAQGSLRISCRSLEVSGHLKLST